MHDYAFRQTGDWELSLDLVQETFAFATDKIDEVATSPNPPGYLYNVLKNHIKKSYSKAENDHVSLDEVAPYLRTEDIVTGEPLAFSLPKDLKDDDKKILILFFEQRLSHEQIAEELGISQPACRKRLSRAKERYKKLLEIEKKMSQKPSLKGYIDRR